MIPDFIVFPSLKASSIILAIEAQGFNVYVSEKCDNQWLRDRYINSNRYRLVWDEGLYGLVRNEDFNTPLFCISTLEDIQSWDDVSLWLDYVIFNSIPTSITPEDLGFSRPVIQHREYTPPGDEIIYEGIKSHCLSTPPDDIDLKGGYSFDCFYDDEKDIKYYEITSPSSITPFTVVVYQFSHKDDSFLFSDIYASNAWASNRMECRYDFHFLTQLWKHLNMSGEFTMDVVKRRVDACYPSRVKDIKDLETEPCVYRRSMREVIGMKRKNEQGHDVYSKFSKPLLE